MNNENNQKSISETYSNRLKVTISNSRPVEFEEFNKSSNGLLNLYNSYKDNENPSILYLEEISKNSPITWILSALATGYVFKMGSDAWDSTCKFIKKIRQQVRNKAKFKKEDFPSRAIDALHDFLDIVAKDPEAKLHMDAIDENGNIIESLDLDSSQAQLMQQYIKQKIPPDTIIHENVTMSWASAYFKSKIYHGKVIIDEIDKQAIISVFFKNKNDKKKCTSKKDWQNLTYIVDVEALYVNGKLQKYTILRVYDKKDSYRDLFSSNDNNS